MRLCATKPFRRTIEPRHFCSNSHSHGFFTEVKSEE